MRLSRIIILVICSIFGAVLPAFASDWYDSESKKTNYAKISEDLLKYKHRSVLKLQDRIEGQLKESGHCSLNEQDILLLGVFYVNNEMHKEALDFISKTSTCSGLSPRVKLFIKVSEKALGHMIQGDDVIIHDEVDKMFSSHNSEAHYLGTLYDIFAHLSKLDYRGAITMLNQLNYGNYDENIHPIFLLLKRWTEAYVYVEMLDIPQAVTHYEAAVDLADKYDYLPVDIGTTFYNLAFMYSYNVMEQGPAFDTANGLYVQLQDYYKEVNEIEDRYYALYGLTILNLNVKDYEGCYNYGMMAPTEAKGINPEFSASLEQTLSMCAVYMNKIDAAVQHMANAERIVKDNGIKQTEEWAITSHLMRARIEYAKDNIKEAYKELDIFQREMIDVLLKKNSKQIMQEQSEYAAFQEKQKAATELAKAAEKTERIVIAASTTIIIMLFLFIYSLHRKNIELRAREAEAIEAKNNQAYFLANISHEVRTPLNAIIGFSEMLQSEIFGRQSKKSMEYIDHIKGSGSHLLSIINELLDLSKLTSGHFDLNPEMVDLHDVISESMHLTEVQAGKKEIKVITDVRATELIEADQRLVIQAVVNLISNGIKFSGEQSTINVAVIQTSRRTKIIIEDHGQGMTKEQSMKVLLPFEQAENVYSRTHEGVGLGLAIVSEIVSLHSGEMTLDSEVGRGTKVTLCFPNSLKTPLNSSDEEEI